MLKNSLQVRRFVGLWFPVLVWATVIFVFSSLPTVKTTEVFLGDFLIKKSAHIVEYGVFALLLYRALINSKVDTKKAIWYAILFSFLYGASDEFHQSFVPGRGPSFRDVLVDTFGAILAMLVVIKRPSRISKLLIRFQL